MLANVRHMLWWLIVAWLMLSLLATLRTTEARDFRQRLSRQYNSKHYAPSVISHLAINILPRNFGSVHFICVWILTTIFHPFFSIFFFFQAEDGIRDDLVTGVQTCALPI